MNQSTITLIIYILLLAPAMIVGFVFARRKMFAPYHKYTMTGITIFNWILIIAVMARSYISGVLPKIPQELSSMTNLIPTIHLIPGLLAQLLATYLVIIMWTERTRFEGIVPAALRIRRIKPVMRATLALWLLTVLLGLGIYLTWNSTTTTSQPANVTPAATEEATLAPGETPNPAATEDAPEPALTEESGG